MATGIVFLFAVDISWSRLLGRITHPPLGSRDEMEKKIVSRFPVLEAGSVCWKHLGQVAKIEELSPGSHLKIGFV